uniref:Uncharacterized protein n=1 Tax=Daucus carota subsp. sativus TaxID=79200 RepID=A0A162A274_DAUCS
MSRGPNTIKQHEDHIKLLRTRKNILADSILDMQVATGKYYTATESVTEKEDTQIDEGTSEHLNGLLCQLKAHIEYAVSHNPLVKDVLGIVATLGNVHDENLSREAQVKFQRISGKSSLPESFYKIENSLESKIRDQESLLANICQTQSLLDEAKSNYEMKKGDFLHFLAQRSPAQPQDSPTKTYEDDLQKLGLRVKQHEDHLKFLRTQINIIKGSIQDLQVTIRKHTSTESVSENEDARSEEGTYEQLIQEKSAAGLICQLNALHETPVSQNPVVKDVLGIVATLGNVDDDNFSREAQVKFQGISGKSSLPENYKIKSILKGKFWEKKRLQNDIRREQSFLDQAMDNLEIKKREFVRFLAQDFQ